MAQVVQSMLAVLPALLAEMVDELVIDLTRANLCWDHWEKSHISPMAIRRTAREMLAAAATTSQRLLNHRVQHLGETSIMEALLCCWKTTEMLPKSHLAAAWASWGSASLVRLAPAGSGQRAPAGGGRPRCPPCGRRKTFFWLLRSPHKPLSLQKLHASYSYVN